MNSRLEVVGCLLFIIRIKFQSLLLGSLCKQRRDYFDFVTPTAGLKMSKMQTVMLGPCTVSLDRTASMKNGGKKVRKDINIACYYS